MTDSSMKRLPGLPIVLALGLLPATAMGGGLEIVVKNPSAAGRANEPVVVAWDRIHRAMPPLEASKLRMVDDQQRTVLFQVDDLDGDGLPDELVFLADLGPREAKVYTIDSGEIKGEASASIRTDAADYKRVGGKLQSITDDDVPGDGRIRNAYRFDGVGWESELIAYRLYLDSRNAIDVQGKRVPGLYWNYIGTSGVDYQQDAEWGMDVLHVGDALGVGGIGLWVADSVLKPVTLERQRTRILARGPVRTVVRVEYRGWNTGEERVDVTSLHTMDAGDRISDQRVFLGPHEHPVTLVTGVVRREGARVLWNAKEGWLCTTGKQSRAGDGLVLAINVDPRSVIRKSERPGEELLLLKGDDGARILTSAYWQGETGKMWSEKETRSALRAASRRITEPLDISIRPKASRERK